MKIYRARAFTYPEKIEGKEVIGNPASVVVYKGNLCGHGNMISTKFIEIESDNLYNS